MGSASSNRLRVVLCRETTPGTTPGTPRMRTMRVTGESLAFNPDYIDSDEIRADRMTIDPILAMQSSGGGINFELSYPVDNSPLSEIYRSVFFNPWVNTAQRDNDGVAASIITGVTTAGTVVTVLTASDVFVASQLVRFTGFGVAGNNGVFKCTTGSATVPAFVGSGITDEASPAAAARMKVVGAVGGATDISATASGLASASLNFTTLGLAVGQWIKVGGTAAGDQFANANLNVWIRITAIAANALTCDNLPVAPVAWTTDAGTGKTIKLFWGDQIRNGTTQTSLSIEKGFLGQTTPTYIVTTGMTANTLSHTLTSKDKVKGAVSFMGMGGSQSTAPLDATVDAATTGQVMSTNANVGRLAENGSPLTSPNWAKEFSWELNNNLASIEAVDSQSPVGTQENECTVTGKCTSRFGDNSLLAKFYAGTPTSFNSRVAKNSQAIIWTFPRVTIKGGGNPAASGKNQEVDLQLDWKAAIDTTYTNSQILCDRIEYFE